MPYKLCTSWRILETIFNCKKNQFEIILREFFSLSMNFVCTQKCIFLFFFVTEIAASTWKCTLGKTYEKKPPSVKMKIVYFFLIQFDFYESIQKSQRSQFSKNFLIAFINEVTTVPITFVPRKNVMNFLLFELLLPSSQFGTQFFRRNLLFQWIPVALYLQFICIFRHNFFLA